MEFLLNHWWLWGIISLILTIFAFGSVVYAGILNEEAGNTSSGLIAIVGFISGIVAYIGWTLTGITLIAILIKYIIGK